MTANLIREAMHATPFRAFDLKLVGRCTISSPRLRLRSASSARPGNRRVPQPGHGDSYGVRWVNLGLVIELIVQSVPAESNGS